MRDIIDKYELLIRRLHRWIRITGRGKKLPLKKQK